MPGVMEEIIAHSIQYLVTTDIFTDHNFVDIFDHISSCDRKLEFTDESVYCLEIF